MNVEIGAEAAQFPEKEYINGIFLAVGVPKMGKCFQLPYISDIFLPIALIKGIRFSRYSKMVVKKSDKGYINPLKSQSAAKGQERVNTSTILDAAGDRKKEFRRLLLNSAHIPPKEQIVHFKSTVLVICNTST
jgi:hypothetical protein